MVRNTMTVGMTSDERPRILYRLRHRCPDHLRAPVHALVLPVSDRERDVVPADILFSYPRSRRLAWRAATVLVFLGIVVAIAALTFIIENLMR